MRALTVWSGTAGVLFFGYSYEAPYDFQGLTKLLGDNAPDCSKEQKFENYFGRKIAIDASMHIYQFLVNSLAK